MTDRGRVLLLTGAASPGGLHRHLQLLAEGLLRRGIAVHAVLPPAPGAETLARACEAAGASVCRRSVSGKTDVRGWRALRKMAAEQEADVVHVHLASPVEAFPALIALRAGGARRIVTTEHAPTWSPLRRPWSRTAKRVVGRGVAAVIAVSEADAAFLQAEFGVPAHKLHVVRNGVPLHGYAMTRAEARRALGLPQDAFLVGYLGALEEKKGLKDLLGAAASVVIDGLQVVLAGEGSLGAELAGRPGCLLLGPLPDPRAFLRSLDVFALPSHQEALPLALLEAMAAGLPIVATAVGGIPEAVENEGTGLLVPPGDPEKLASALRRLARDPGLAGRLGEAARRSAERHFSADRMVEQTLAVYRRLDIAGARPML